MKFDIRIKIILLALLLIITLISARKRYHHQRKEKLHKKEKLQKKEKKQPTLFKERKLNKNPKRMELLTNEALKEILISLGYTIDNINKCLPVVPLKNKKNTLGAIISVSKKAQYGPAHKNVIATFKCPQILDLTKKFEEKDTIPKLAAITKVFSTKHIKHFFKRR